MAPAVRERGQAGCPAGAAAAGQVAGPPRGLHSPPPASGPPPPPFPPPAGASPRGPRARRPVLRSPPGVPAQHRPERAGRRCRRAHARSPLPGRTTGGRARGRGAELASAGGPQEAPRAGPRPVRSPEPGGGTARGHLPPERRGRGQEARFKVTRPDQVGLAGPLCRGSRRGAPSGASVATAAARVADDGGLGQTGV